MSSQTLDVYKLIQQLDRTEKSYFKKFGFKYEKEGEKDEIILFDMMNRYLKKADINEALEADVKKAYQKKTGKENFVAVKNALYTALIKSLTEYDKAQGYQAKVLQLFSQAKSLLKRNLPRSAHKAIKKAQEDILAHEDFQFQLLFADLEQHVGIHANDKEVIRKAAEDKSKAIQHIQDLQQIKQLYERTYQLHRTHGADREGNVKDDLDPIYKEFGEIKLKGKSDTYRFNHHSLGKLLGYISSDMEFAIEHTSKMAELIESRPALFEDKDQVVLATISDLISHGLEQKSVNYFEKHFDTFQQFKTTGPETTRYKQHQLLKIASLYHHLYRNFEAFKKLKPQFEKEKGNINPHLRNALYIDFIHAFYCMKDYRTAIAYLHEQLDYNKKTESRLDIEILSELTLLAINYEQEKCDVLEYLIRSVENRFKKSEAVLKNEQTIISFFKKMTFKHAKDEAKVAEQTLKELAANNHSASVGTFDFTVWFRAMKNGSSYVDAQEKLDLPEFKAKLITTELITNS